jgi:hypothetical protein
MEVNSKVQVLILEGLQINPLVDIYLAINKIIRVLIH